MPHDATESGPFEQQYLMWCGSIKYTKYILLLLVSPKIGFTKNTSGNQPAAAWTKDTFPSSPLEPFPMLGYWHPKHFVNQRHFGFDWVSKLTSGPTRIWDSIRVTIQLEQAYMDSEEKLKCISLLTDPDVLLYYSIQKKTSPVPISLSSRGKSRRGILEIGSHPCDPTCLWPGGTKQQGLPFSGALLDCGSRNPGFWAVQKTTCFFSFSGAIFNQAFKAI